MFLHHWLYNLKSGFGQFASRSQAKSPRRRQQSVTMAQPTEALETRVLLSAQPMHGFQPFSMPDFNHQFDNHQYGNSNWYDNGNSKTPDIGSPVTYAAGGSPVAIAGTAQIPTSDTNLAGSSLKVQILPFDDGMGDDHWGGCDGMSGDSQSGMHHSSSNSNSTDVLSIVAGNGVTLDGGSVLYNGTTIGTVTGGTSGQALAVKFNSSATQAGAQAVLGQVSYSNSDSSVTAGERHIQLLFTNGNGHFTNLGIQEVQITPAAAITDLGPTAQYVAGTTPVVIAPSAKITDSTNSFASSSLNVQLSPTPSSTATDVLSIVAGNGVTDNAGSVVYNSTTIGTVTGGTGGTALLVSFNSSATQTGVQAVLDQIGYSNTSSTPTLGDVKVEFHFTNGNGAAASPVSQQVSILSSPAITQIGSPVTYSAGGAPVVLAGSAQVIDTQNAYASSSLTVQFSPTQSSTTTDVLNIVAGNGVTVSSGDVSFNSTVIGTVTGGTAGAALVVTFNSSATQTGIEAVLNQISYSNTSTSVGSSQLAVTFQFTDGSSNVSQLANQQINVVPAAAIIDVGQSVTYTKGGSPVLIASSAQVTDSNDALSGSSLDVAFAKTPSATSTKVLSIVEGNGVTLSSGQVSYNNTVIGTVTGGTGDAALVVTFNASATQTGINAVLNQVAYSNTNSMSRRRSIGITLQFTDGGGSASPIVHQNVEVVD